MEMENISFHEEVRSSYLSLANENDHNRWIIIDANVDMETVEEQIWESVREKMEI
jgi:thymidylate kinase